MIADELEINEEGDKQTLVNEIANALEDVSAEIWYREQQIVYWQKPHKKHVSSQNKSLSKENALGFATLHFFDCFKLLTNRTK